MATRKDQLDAFVFARRRMVANLVAPSPTGSDEAAPRPVKTFFTSAILSAIAVAGVVVLGVFHPSAPSGWESGLAVDSNTGARYVYSPQDKQLHPVWNITSARLLLGGNFKKFDVPDSVIDGGPAIGQYIGINGAPEDVPPASSVDLVTWNLCYQSANRADQTQPGGKTVLEIGYSADGENKVVGKTGFVVHDSAGVNFLIAGDYAYQVSNADVLFALTNVPAGQSGTEGPLVSDAWLKAFAQGGEVQYPVLDGLGEPLTLPNQIGSHVGDYTATDSANYIETSAGLVEVNPFLYKLYAANPQVSKSGAKELPGLSESQITAAQPKNELAGSAASASFGGVAADWPQDPVTPLDSDAAGNDFGTLCAGFSGHYENGTGVPQLSLSYGTDLPKPLGDGGVSRSGSGLADTILVEPGHGVLARDVSNGNNLTSGPVYLITDTGQRYPTVPGTKTDTQNAGPAPDSTVAMLQYQSVTTQPIPDSWMSLIQLGAKLDPAAAGQVATSSGQ
jgi:type VII secretion protein EccB